MKTNNKFFTGILSCLLMFLFSLPSFGQGTCDFSVANSATVVAGQTEAYIEVDAAGAILQVFNGAGPHALTGTAPSVTTVHHLIWDDANPPANVPPLVGDNISVITGGCFNDFAAAAITLACACEDAAIAGTYTPGGGDTQAYYLVDPATGDILDTNTTGDFGVDEAIGDYLVYALAYDSANPPTVFPTTNMSEFSEDGCYNPDFLTNVCCVQKTQCCALTALTAQTPEICAEANPFDLTSLETAMNTSGGTGVFTYEDVTMTAVTSPYTPTNGEVITATFTEDVTLCEETTTITFTVNPTPTAMVVAVTTPICSGEDAVFTVTGTPGANVTIDENGIVSTQTLPATDGIGTITILAATTDQTVTLTSITDPVTSCTQVLASTATIVVNALPSLTAQTPIVCAEDLPFDLTSLEGAITADAGAFTYDVAGETAYTAADGDIVTVTFVDGTTNCTESTTITFTVNPTPVLAAQTPIVCAEDLPFDLTSLEGAITADAGAFTYDVAGETAYTAADGDIVTVTFVDGTTNCTESTTVTFTVNDTPTLTAQTPIVCSEDLPFDLTSLEGAITADAGAFTYDVAGETAYTAADGDVVTVTFVDGTTSCTETTTITFTVNPTPVLAAQTPIVCAEDLPFDLTSLEGAITADAGAFTYDVAGETAYTAADGDIVTVTFVDGTTNCTESTTVTFTVNPTPTLTAQTPIVCAEDLPFDLTSLEGAITADAGAFTYDVAGETAYTAADGDIVTVTFVDGTTNCSASTTVTFTVNPTPTLTAQTPTVCADGLPFDITTLEGAITTDIGGTFTYDVAGETAYTPTDGEVVDVTYTDANTCEATTTITFALTTITASIDPSSFACDAAGNVNAVLVIDGTNGITLTDGTNSYSADGTYSVNLVIGSAGSIDLTEVGGTATCAASATYDLQGLTCDGVTPPDPPISICTLGAAIDTANPTCDGANGNLQYTITLSDVIGTVTADNANATDNNDGTWTLTVAAGTMEMVTFSDDLNTGNTACIASVAADAANLVCDDNGDPSCSLTGTIDPDSFICDANGNIIADLIISGASGGSVTSGSTVYPGDGTYSITLVTGTTGTLNISDPNGFGVCSLAVPFTSAGLTCLEVGEPPVPATEACILAGTFDEASIVCDGAGNATATVEITAAHDASMIGSQTVSVTLGTSGTIDFTDAGYTGTAACGLSFAYDLTGLTCEGIDDGNPPVPETDLCILAGTFDEASIVCDGAGNATGMVMITAAHDAAMIGTQTVSVTLGASGTIDFIDAAYTGTDACALSFAYDLTGLTCEGIDDGNPPVPETDVCILAGAFDPATLVCDGAGNATIDVTITAAHDASLIGTQTLAVNVGGAGTLTITDAAYTGTQTCAISYTYNLLGYTCDGVTDGDPPIIDETKVCILDASFDESSIVCNADGTTSATVNIIAAHDATMIGAMTVAVNLGETGTITIADAGYTGNGNCTLSFDYDLVGLTCDGVGAGDPPVEETSLCILEASFDESSIVCGGISGATANIEITNAHDASMIETIVFAVNLGQAGTFTFTDSGYTGSETCEYVVSYDLTGLTCDGVDDGNPPIPETEVCTLSAFIVQGSIVCDGNGGATADVTVSGAHDASINGTSSQAITVGNAGTITITDSGYTGEGNCTVELNYDLTAQTCDGVEEGDEPIGETDVCILNASFDTNSIVCDGNGGATATVTVIAAHDASMIGAMSVAVNLGESGTITVTDPDYTGTDACELSFDYDLTGQTCEGVEEGGSPIDESSICILAGSFDESSIACDGSGGATIDVTITDAHDAALIGTQSVAITVGDAGTITISDTAYTGADACELTYDFDLQGLTCDGVDAGEPPVIEIPETDTCILEGTFDTASIVCDGNGGATATIEITAAHNADIIGFMEVAIMLDQSGEIIIDDTAYTGNDVCELVFDYDLSGLTCDGVDAGNPPVEIECEAPTVDFATLCQDDNGFTILVNVEDLGNSATLFINDDQGTIPAIVGGGVFSFGYYPNGTEVEVSVFAEYNCEPIVVTLTETCSEEPTECTLVASPVTECNADNSFSVIFAVSGGSGNYSYSTQPNGAFASIDNGAFIVGPFANESTYYAEIIDNETGCSLTFSNAVECTVTAVELAYFKGEVERDHNQLNWITFSEIENDYFNLMRSADGVNFTKITTINGAGTSNTPTAYDFKDIDVRNNETWFYRLEMVDNNGKRDFSEIVKLNRNADSEGIVTIAPVPTIDNVTIEYYAVNVKTLRAKVYNISGKLVDNLTYQVQNGINQLVLNASTYANGTYLIAIENNGTIETEIFIKE